MIDFIEENRLGMTLGGSSVFTVANVDWTLKMSALEFAGKGSLSTVTFGSKAWASLR
jgi:hypothetical protein